MGLSVYHYRARKQSGDMVAGEEAAQSASALRGRLSAAGLIPIDITVKKSNLWQRLQEPVSFGPIFTLQKRAFFFRSMARLVAAGLSLEDSLSLTRDLFTAREHAPLDEMMASVRKGQTFAASMEGLDAGFTAADIQQIAAGEQTGQLAQVLGRLSHRLSEMVTFRSKVRGALIYPALLMVAVLITLILMMTVVLPNFAPIFQGQEGKLPLLTQFIMGLGDILLSAGLYIIPTLFIGGIGMILLLRRPEMRHRWHQAQLKLPVLRSFILAQENITLATTVGLGVSSGVGLDQALSMAQESASNQQIKQDVKSIRADVRSGKKLAACLSQQDWTLPYVRQFAVVGENTGQLGSMMLEAADLMAEAHTDKLEKTVAVLTPLLTLLAGAIVALLVAGIVMGMMSINDLAI